MRELYGSASIAAIALLALAGCNDSGVNGPNEFTVGDFIVGVVNLQQTSEAALMTADAPAGSGGPTLAVDAAASVIWGGASRSHLTADQEFTTVIVSVVGHAGHYRLSVPATAELDLLLSLPQALPTRSVDIAYQVVSEAGAVSDPIVKTADVTLVEPGPVQLSVAWDSPADLDLHVLGPDSVEIYWGRLTYGNATLVVSSNDGCTAGSRNESVVWLNDAPRGNYTVRLGVESLCGAAEANYVVRFRMPGRGDYLHAGTLTTTTADGEGEGETVATHFY